jgi:hypothetical protein
MERVAINKYSHLTAAVDTEVFCFGIHRLILPNPPKSGVEDRPPQKGMEGNQVEFEPLTQCVQAVSRLWNPQP